MCTFQRKGSASQHRVQFSLAVNETQTCYTKSNSIASASVSLEPEGEQTKKPLKTSWMNFIPGQKSPARLWHSTVTFNAPMFLLLEKQLFRKLKMTCKSSIPLVLIFTFHLLHILLSFSKYISAEVQGESPGIQEKPGCMWMNKQRRCQHQDILVLSWGRDVQIEGVESIRITSGIHYFYNEMLLNNILSWQESSNTRQTQSIHIHWKLSLVYSFLDMSKTVSISKPNTDSESYV